MGFALSQINTSTSNLSLVLPCTASVIFGLLQAPAFRFTCDTSAVSALQYFGLANSVAEKHYIPQPPEPNTLNWHFDVLIGGLGYQRQSRICSHIRCYCSPAFGPVFHPVDYTERRHCPHVTVSPLVPEPSIFAIAKVLGCQGRTLKPLTCLVLTVFSFSCHSSVPSQCLPPDQPNAPQGRLPT